MTRDIELYFVSVLIKEYWTQTLSNTNLLIQGNLRTVIIDLKPPQRWAAEVFYLGWLYCYRGKMRRMKSKEIFGY